MAGFNLKKVVEESAQEQVLTSANGDAIFNNGVAGVAENITVTVEAKTDSSNKPDFKIIYTDENGGTVNEGFYKEDPNYAKTEGAIKFRDQKIGNVVDGILGSEFQLKEYADYNECLLDVMRSIVTLAKDKKYRLVVSYGTISKPESYLRVRAWNKYIESMDLPCTLALTAKEKKERIAMNNDAANPLAAAPVVTMTPSTPVDNLPF